MSTEEIEAELKRLRRRLSELEAANGLRSLAPANEDEEVLAEVCGMAGIGVRTIQGGNRESETVRKRSVVARFLHRTQGWTQERVAKAMRKTERGVRGMLKR